MEIALIAAMDRNRVIGREGGLPWHLPADLAFFKQATMGKPVLMGRRTYESIGRPLPGRTNIVVSGRPDFQAPGCAVVPTPDAGLRVAEGAAELMVLGGATLFRHFLDRADRLYLTEVETTVEDGDVWFPAIDRSHWRLIEETRHPADARNACPMRFVILERRARPDA